MKIGILGAGSWGAAQSILLHENGHAVWLWSPDKDEAEKIRTTRRLIHKLPEVRLPEAVQVEDSLEAFIDEAEILVVAVPAKVMRLFAEYVKPKLRGVEKIVVNTSKGLEDQTLLTMSGLLEEAWQQAPIAGVAALSGPSHAEEVARGLPTAVVAAHNDRRLAERVQRVYQSSRFRVYTNPDPKGVETGAALKNVIAIAVGISDGLGFGDNARAALISRGVYELGQIGGALGADPKTFTGLSGLGDLVVTCTSRYSRNRRLGELLAKGYSPAEAEEEIGMVVEGMYTVRAVPEIRRRCGVEMPISEQVYAITFNHLAPKEAVENLMQRDMKSEH